MGCSSSKEEANVSKHAKIHTNAAIKQTKTPTKQMVNPIKQTEIAMKQTEALIKQTDKQIKETLAPIKQADVPIQQSVTPIKQVSPAVEEMKNGYEEVDQHARNAPVSLKNSIEDLVNYLLSPSKEPRMQVRAFFVWISENIKYDADGYFGKAERSPCDALSVIKYGKSVCAGYANVMEAFCRQANIKVKKITGYAKGVSHSEDHMITTNQRTNHAWNAVEIHGKWYFLDATWGAGHINTQRTFEKEFNEFYFLTDPEKLINTHFPYMNDDMEESKKWQLLKKPVKLEDFSKKVRQWPKSYAVGIKPLSHQNGFVEVDGQLEMTFKIESKADVTFKESLNFFDGKVKRKMDNATFRERQDNIFKIKICPPKVGKYELNLYGKRRDDEGSHNALYKYLVKCNSVKDSKFRFPITYTQAQTDLCVLHEPMRNNLPANSEVKISLISSALVRVMVNKEFLKKTRNKFEGMVKTGLTGTTMTVYGSKLQSGSLSGLYAFDIE